MWYPVKSESALTAITTRVRDVTLKLIGANFNRRNEYWLILEDAQTETGYQKYPVIIDLAFQDDFF